MIWLGTSGYSYADWHETYYPADLESNRRLAFYAAEFDTVEINYTYYRMPTADHMQRLATQTPDTFCFAVKAHQDITHNRRDDPVALAQFRAAMTPLQQQEKMGAVLLQFPHSFRNTSQNVDYIRRCVDRLPDLPLVIEFRHDGWITQRTLALFRELGVGFCNVDMPQLPGLLPKTAFVTSPTAYVRFHGRNKEKWWKHDQAWERYSYTYEKTELQEWIPKLLEMNEQAENLFVYANNHWQGQSVTAVRQLRLLLDLHDAEA
jgi:uncharacterized protein YecE (DUF72 family)